MEKGDTLCKDVTADEVSPVEEVARPALHPLFDNPGLHPIIERIIEDVWELNKLQFNMEFLPILIFRRSHLDDYKLKQLWRLRGINTTFKNIMDTYCSRKPTVGVRIRKLFAHECSELGCSEDLYRFQIYGPLITTKPVSKLVAPFELCSAIKPHVAEMFFVVQGILLNDGFISSLQSMKLDKVQIVLFCDIKGFDFCFSANVTLAHKIGEILSMFPAAKTIELSGYELPSGIFDNVRGIGNMTRIFNLAPPAEAYMMDKLQRIKFCRVLGFFNSFPTIPDPNKYIKIFPRPSLCEDNLHRLFMQCVKGMKRADVIDDDDNCFLFFMGATKPAIND